VLEENCSKSERKQQAIVASFPLQKKSAIAKKAAKAKHNREKISASAGNEVSY